MLPDTFPPYESYVKHWKAVLTPLRGWSAAQVERWTEQFKRYFDGRVHEFHRNDPLWYVAEELLPTSVKQPFHVFLIIDLTWTFENMLSDFVEGVVDTETLDWHPM